LSSLEAFSAELFRIDEPGGWHFVAIPDEFAPDQAGAWGRTPVFATVNGHRWATSAWRDSQRGWLLAVPKKVRGALVAGDQVSVSIEPDMDRLNDGE
jgi:hypothetical protein